MLKKFSIIVAAMFLMVLAVGIASAVGQPSCDFEADETSGNEDFTVTFTGHAYNMSAPFSYRWDFGDTTGVEVTSVHTVSPVTHTYLNPGKYTVSLAVYDIGFPVTRWYKSEIKDYITVTNIPPVAWFDITPDHGKAPLTVAFVVGVTGNGEITRTWNFGDGTSYIATDDTGFTHTYAAKGSYTVTLNASNDGGYDLVSKDITVYAPLPVADFYATSQTTGAKPFAVQFEDDSGYDGDIDNYNWEFGDGSTSNEENPLHVYTTAGTYTVSLTVNTISGADTETKADYVTVLNEPEDCPEPVIPQSNIGVFRPGNGNWYLNAGFDSSVDHVFHFGTNGDVPLTGDFNGDGTDDVAVFRPASGNWYIDTNKDSGVDIQFHYGKAGDIPVVGDWDKDGTDDVGVFRPANGNWYLETTKTGVVNKTFHFGSSGDIPVIGTWNLI